MLDHNTGTGQDDQMKPFLAVVAMGLIFSARPVEARLGETIAQCEQRYGPVVEKRPSTVKESDPEACIFSKSGITALVEFKRGIAWRIVFRMLGMTPKDAETLLKANMADGGWGPVMKVNGQDFRLSSDRRRIAIYSSTKAQGEITTLEIASRDYGAASYAAYSAKVAEAIGTGKERAPGQQLKGF